MTNIYIITQNLKIESLKELSNNTDKNVFISTHMLFPNEKNIIEKYFSSCVFEKYADYLNDEENEHCDQIAYDKNETSVHKYYKQIKHEKNKMIAQKVIEKYPNCKGFLCCNDLGVDVDVWKEYGFEIVDLDYYHIPVKKVEEESTIKKFLKNIKPAYWCFTKLRELKNGKYSYITDEVYESTHNGKKYVFIGKLSRVEYRTDMEWKKSEEAYEKLKFGRFESKDKCQYLSSLHECSKCLIPDDEKYDVRYIQDGYLPPNYSSCYLRFKPNNVSYYTWDSMGERTFKCFDIPATIMPFRKKMYLPEPKFNNRLTTILVATSGPGDWTAQKNRSDEDLMLETFVELARRFPDVEIIYRCHPTWIHPMHNGVNSINRVREYIEYTGLNNIHLSTNIPQGSTEQFIVTYPRSSFAEDLAKADIVFGEHSVSMLDAGFEQVPFASVNVTGRRNLFCGVSELGFPHCESVDDIENLLKLYGTKELSKIYANATVLYNSMTDKED